MNSLLTNRLSPTFSYLDDISIKTFFGGFGVISKETMFGWMDGTDFYLRGHAFYRSFFIELNMTPLHFSFGVAKKLWDYYKVPDSLIADHKKLSNIIQMAIACANYDKYKQNQLKKSRIRDLPNMTLSFEKLLYQIGIIDTLAFQNVGYLEAFYRVQKSKENISINVLFCFYASLNNIHVASLSDDRKNDLKFAYQNFVESLAVK